MRPQIQQLTFIAAIVQNQQNSAGISTSQQHAVRNMHAVPFDIVLYNTKKTLPIFQMSSPEYWHWRKTTNYVNYLGLEYRGCCRLTCQNCGQTCRLYAISWHEADPVATDWPWTETLQQKTFHHKHINNLLVCAIKVTMHGYHLVIIKLKITECQWSSMPALQLQKHLTPLTMLQPVDMIMIHLTVGC